MSKLILDLHIEKNNIYLKVSYPLREYISSKKDDDYHKSSSVRRESSSEVNIFIFFYLKNILLESKLQSNDLFHYFPYSINNLFNILFLLFIH
jgi:hypothetical protein